MGDDGDRQGDDGDRQQGDDGDRQGRQGTVVSDCSSGFFDCFLR